MASIGPPLADVNSNDAAQQHVTLTGEVFEVPDFTMKEIHDAIPAHCFQPSVLRSMAYVVRDFVYFSVLTGLTTYIQPAYVPSLALRVALWTAYTTLQGMVMTGIWILAHECGHGAFSKHRRLNNVMGLLMHSFLLVPYHSWRITHSAHHKATGNIERDTAFVPHTRASWLARNFGPKADAASVEFAHLAEDAPVVTLWNCVVHQLFGWPGYLLCNLTGQKYAGEGFPQISHFWFGQDSVFFKGGQLGLIVLSDLGVGAMIAALAAVSVYVGSWNTVLLYVVPWLWVNNWIVAITFLQHTDGSLPHYNNSTWTFARGATATIDRDLGFIDSHLFHNIIGTHVCHHLVSTIPFYHAAEASVAIRKVMGRHYQADTQTGFWTAFWKSQRECKFVEESVEGSGIYFFRNLHGKGVAARDLTGGKSDDKNWAAASGLESKSAMPLSRNMDAKRRFSQGLSSTLPLLSE